MLQRNLLAGISLALLLGCSPLYAQTSIQTRNGSAVIVTGNTYQLLASAANRQSITIENNNASGNCFIEVSGLVAAGETTATTKTISGISVTAVQASIVLLPGGSYTRYFPHLPLGPIVGTCASSAASIYLDAQ